MKPIDLVLSKLSSPKRNSRGWYEFRCPAHSDKTPSCGCHEDEHGVVWFKCQAGCSSQAIVSAIGLEMSDLFPKNGSAPKHEIVYEYTNRKGEPYYQVVRLEGKRFQQRQPDGKGGFEYNLKNIKPVPFRFHLLEPTIAEKKTVFVCEGEKDVLALERQGCYATCNSGGAGKWDPQGGYSKFFQGATVVIVADRDEPGEKHALDVQKKLKPFAASITIVQARLGKDAYDHLAAGCGIDEFVPFVEGGLNIERFDTGFKMVELSFLWEPYLPKGKCVLFDADGGTGKTSMLLAVAAAFSNGVMPVTIETCDPVPTLYLHRGEDATDELHTVFTANKGNPEFINYYSNKDLLFDADGIRRLKTTVKHHGYKLIIVDALYYFIQGVVRETADALQVLPVLERLTKLAEETGATIVNIRHTRKGLPDDAASSIGMGSVQFRNSHRGQLVARYHPDPEHKGLVVVTDEKGSLLAERGEPFGFRRVGKYGEIQWVPDVDNPFEKKRMGGARGPDAEGTAEAAKAILKILAYGPVACNKVVAQVMDELGCGRATVFRARKRLTNVMSRGLNWEVDPFAEEPEAWWTK